MKQPRLGRTLTLAASVLCLLFFVESSGAQTPAKPRATYPDYDRNPQTFVPNIFWAKSGDYRKAVQRIYHAPGQASFIELPLVAAR